MNTSLVQARIDPQVKSNVESILEGNGLDVPTAIRMYFAKIIQVGGIPFSVRLTNPETREALEESERIAHDESVKGYGSFKEMLTDLNLDDDEADE
ncbi:type II toxin-antitoxin system RelB/DinJ family antitoxin [Mobiluncus porci]|uniref:Type II toxin-antitoxin system RelB/DinJ family antitoxin n=1 Tax=Mobiluncus porci TaxID=2652278 RepID=A0A7K0K3X2_9ACTO|nr:type II toxin-antitoxin system RelB/DinJ family antitoxin [Mobiluncus porci]MST50186.1 type II toxin-antitoxin system RelB/DinJ family antitoxin [Mobiluncus porci]